MRKAWSKVEKDASRLPKGARLLLLLVTLFLPIRLHAAAASFSVSLDRDTVVLGETATLTLSFQGEAPQGIPQLPQIPGIQIAPDMSSGTSTTIINGVVNTTHSYSVTVLPQQPGEFVIPAMSADVGGKRVMSQPVRLKVLNAQTAAQPGQGESRLAFLSLLLPKSELYVGEVCMAELRIFLRGDVQRITDSQLPSLGEGFTLSQYQQGQAFQTRVGNVPFQVIPLRFALTPNRPGTLTLGPGSGSAVLHIPAGRSSDPFDNFFGPRTQARKVVLPLEQQTVTVLPLPAENRPSTFTGAVGKFDVAFSVSPTNVAVGDPMSIKVQIKGQGQLNLISLPDQAAWKNFKRYEATSKVEANELGVEGTKVFEQTIVPETTEIRELPAFVFSYFDPERKSYRSYTHPPIPLLVRPSGSTPSPLLAMPNRSGQDNTASGQDIVPIKTRPGIVATAGTPLIRQPAFLALQSVPFLAWIGAFLWRRRAEALARNPRLVRQRHVSVLVRKGTRELKSYAEANRPTEFFTTLFRLLQEQIGERLDLPASSITEAVIEEHLRPRGLPDSVLIPLQEVFQLCNLAKYAPVQGSQQLAALIPKIEGVLHQLQEVKL
jgi:hypothetical protein